MKRIFTIILSAIMIVLVSCSSSVSNDSVKHFYYNEIYNTPIEIEKKNVVVWYSTILYQANITEIGCDESLYDSIINKHFDSRLSNGIVPFVKILINNDTISDILDSSFTDLYDELSSLKLTEYIGLSFNYIVDKEMNYISYLITIPENNLKNNQITGKIKMKYQNRFSASIMNSVKEIIIPNYTYKLSILKGMLKNYEKDKICCINREIIVNQEVDKSNNEIERFKINSIISKKIDNPLSFETKDNFNNSTHKILSSGLFYFIKDDGLFEQLN